MDSLPMSRVGELPTGWHRSDRFSRQQRCAWNNLGRNVVFADASLRPLAIFGDTLFPDDDEASQFDLDIHAIVELADTGQIAVVNHLGSVRIFEPPRFYEPGPVMTPYLNETRRLEFVDDIERMVGLGDRLVTSRPRGRASGRGAGDASPSPPHAECLEADTAHESFGFVTALAAEIDVGGHRLGGPGR